MSSNLHTIKEVNLPRSAHGFPLETTDDLRRAYREYAKANDARLIFDGDELELSTEGRNKMFEEIEVLPPPQTSEEFWDDMFEYDNVFASLEKQVQEDEYWKELKERIDAFTATEEGKRRAQELYEELWQYLNSNMLHDGETPDGLYERVVAAQLCWQAEVRTRHKAKYPELYQREPPMRVDIIEAFDTIDKSIKSKKSIYIPASHTFEDFGKLMCHWSEIRGAKDTDIWYYENPHSDDIYSDEHFMPITERNYQNFKILLTEAPKREGLIVVLTLWHVSQIDFVRTNLNDSLPPGVLDLNRSGPMDEELEKLYAEMEAALKEGNLVVNPLTLRQLRPDKSSPGS